MELLQLRYFLALAESEHLSRTAEQLHISAPSLSITVKRLEDELGVQLFSRDNRRLKLNENGRSFYQYVRQSLHTLDLGVQLTRQAALSPALSITMTSTPVWVDVLYGFEQSYPDIRVDYRVIAPEEFTAPDSREECSFYLGVAEDMDPKRFCIRRVLPPEKPVALLPADHPLAGRESIRLEELRGECFISVQSENASAHKHMLALCHEAGFAPVRIYYCDYLTRGKLLQQKRGVAISTELGAEMNFVPSEQVKVVPVSAPILTRTQAVCWRGDRTLNETERLFLDYAVRYFKENPPAFAAGRTAE